jgi:hypothetical protein
VGMVLCHLSGVLAQNFFVLGTKTFSEVGYLMFLVTWLGTPDCFRHLPHWPSRGLPEVAEAKPWPVAAQLALGGVGVEFLRGLLRFQPSERLSMEEAGEHPWLHPQRLALGGRPAAPTPWIPQGVMAQAGLTADGGRKGKRASEGPSASDGRAPKRVTSQGELRQWRQQQGKKAGLTADGQA